MNWNSDSIATPLEKYLFSKSQHILRSDLIHLYLEQCLQDKNVKDFIFIFEDSYLLIKNKDIFLHYTCFWGNMEILKYLCEQQKCNVNHLSNLGNPPIYFSVVRNFLDLTKYLLIQGADINSVNCKIVIRKIQNQILYPILCVKYTELIYESSLFNKIWQYYQ